MLFQRGRIGKLCPQMLWVASELAERKESAKEDMMIINMMMMKNAAAHYYYYQ